jgi:hypothetical protein
MVHYAFNKEDNVLSIETICQLHGVSKSGYYNWLNNRNNISEKRQAEIDDEKNVMEMFSEVIHKVGHVPGKRTFKTYLFRDFDYKISIARCAKIRKKMNIIASIPHKDAYKGQATHNHVCSSMQDHVKRDFKQGPRRVILTDITYLYFGMNRELFYLCTFKDAFTCEILGYAVSKRMNVDLVKKAYDNMMAKHKDSFKKDVKVYIHSDQGSQYLSTEFKQILFDDKFIQSCSRRGNSQDNAPMESFFSRLKTAIMNILVTCSDYDTASQLVINYLDAYNTKHYQYGLGGLTPEEFYQYCTTGIYSLTDYFGIPKEKLNSIESVIKAREKAAREKRERNKANEAKRKTEKGSCVEPVSIVQRDKKKIKKEIKGWVKEKKLVESQIFKYQKLLDDILKAETFISSINEAIMSELTDPTSWIKYQPLKYVNQMNGMF